MNDWLKKIIPEPRVLREHKLLRHFGARIHHPELWHMSRRSVSGAAAVGLFLMYMPPFGQFFVAAALAVVLRFHVPIAAGLTWVSNPLTAPPMYYLAYLVGARLLGLPVHGFDPEFWLDVDNWLGVLAPLGLGSLVCGAVSAVLGYTGVQVVWRWRLRREIRRRKALYRAALTEVKDPSTNRHT